MTEPTETRLPRPPGLPPAGRPTLLPPGGSADRVLGLARRRRRLKGATVAGSAAAAVVTVAVLVSGSGGTASLRPVDLPPAVTVGPSSGPGLPTSGPSATSGPLTTASPGAPGSPGAVVTPVATVSPGTVASASPVVTPPRSQDLARPMTRSTQALQASFCVPSNATLSAGWCLYYSGATSTTYGTAATMSVNLCRLPQQGSATVHFAQAAEADFTLDDSAGDAWGWRAHSHPPGGPHDLVIAESTCAVWTTVWPARDDHGVTMPIGSYTLTAPVLGDGLPGPSSAAGVSYGFSVTA